MNGLKPHRFWLLALCGAMAVMAGSDPLLAYMHDLLAQDNQTLVTKQRELKATLQQLRDDAATAQRLSQTMSDSEMAKYLAPSDRLQIAASLEPLAAVARFSAFTYSLSPEKMIKPEGVESGSIAESLVVIQTDAPQDIAIRRFFQHLQEQLPGRLQLQHVKIERIAADNMEALSAANLRLNADAQWLSNGSEKTAENHKAGGP